MEQRIVDSSCRDERWRTVPDSRLKFRYWDDECVLYHGAAGDTHRVPGLVGKLVQTLVQGETSIGDLAACIDLHEDDVYEAVQHMRRLGIVERV